ncbi:MULTISPECIES: hypothetical protein [unclassified Pseudoxanthomonas]
MFGTQQENPVFHRKISANRFADVRFINLIRILDDYVERLVISLSRLSAA